MINRETIYTAAFAKTAGVAGLVTRSRRLRHWNQVDPTEQPALFFAQDDQVAVTPPPAAGGAAVSGPTRWALTATLYLYVHESTCAEVLGLTGVPADELLPKAFNLLLDRIEAAFAPVGEMEQTLGKLVARCRIAGEITTDGGVLGPQAVAQIPLEILCK